MVKMPFSHHSHSGQFCTHAKNSLEEMVLCAISRRMSHFALTEHLPRYDTDLYPDENTHPLYTRPGGLFATFDEFVVEAKRLQMEYADRIHILVGFETEWINDGSQRIVEDALRKHRFDMFVGSLHHVHTYSIDYDADNKKMYNLALQKSGGPRGLCNDYLDAQYEMLTTFRPPVVGHFDLFRLLSANPEQDLRDWPDVWERVLKATKFIADYGGLLEINTSALRKGLRQPYPRAEICTTFKDFGGRFTLSDDSHCTEHIGTNYERVLEFINDIGLTEIHFLERASNPGTSRLNHTVVKSISVDDMRRHEFFKT